MPNGHRYWNIDEYDTKELRTEYAEWAPIKAKILATEEATVIELHLFDEVFVGVAKTHPEDMPGDPIIGRDLALYRAVKKATRKLRDRTFRAVGKHEKRMEARKEMKPPKDLQDWEEVRKKGWMDVSGKTKNFGFGIEEGFEPH